MYSRRSHSLSDSVLSKNIKIRAAARSKVGSEVIDQPFPVISGLIVNGLAFTLQSPIDSLLDQISGYKGIILVFFTNIR